MYSFIDNTFQTNTKDEENFLQTLIEVMNSKNEKVYEIEDNILKISCDESICNFLK